MINKDTKKISNQRNFSSFDFDEKKMKMKIIFGTTMFICSLMLFVIYVAALLPSDPSTIYTTDLTWGILSVFGLIAAGFITTLKFSMFCKKQCIKCLVKGILSGIIFIFQLIWLFIDICNSMWDFLPESIVHLKEIMTAFNYLGVVICTTLLLFSIKSFCFHKICKDTKESSK